MKVIEVAAKYVFEKLGKGETVVAVDFKSGAYIYLLQKSVESVQKLVTREGEVKFFTITYEV